MSQLSGSEPKLAAMVEEHPDYTLSEYCEAWQEQQGMALDESTMCRWLQKQQLTLKKTRRSQQAQTAQGQQQRLDSWQQVRAIEPENLVFLDEIGLLLGMVRWMGRSQKGTRVDDIKPFYRGSRVTVIGASSQQKVLTCKGMEQSMHGEQCKQFLREDLAPQLGPAAVLTMDNLPAHKVEGVSERLAAVGARALYLSPYSPEFNP